jgi:hypothetical protein
MARYRKIDVRLYGDEKYRALSRPQPNAQYLWLFLLTGPHTTNIPGLFVAGEAGMAEAIEWPLKDFRKAFMEVSGKGMVKADWTSRVVWIPNSVAYNPPENPNVITGWRRAFDEIPECSLKQEALAKLKSFIFSLRDNEGNFREAFRKAFRKAFPEPFTEPFPKGSVDDPGDPFRKQEHIQEQEQEQEQEHTGREGKAFAEEGETGTPEDRESCRSAFDRWSHVSRKRGISIEQNEGRKVHELMKLLSQGAPVVRGRESIPAFKLIPLAADGLREEGADFKGIAYACTSVKNRIAEWIANGMSPPKKDDPPRRKLTSVIQYDNT